MSETLRIALVIEGPTDYVVLTAAISSLLPDREITFQALQPEFSAAFEAIGGEMGLGWAGVYRWCRQVSREGGGSVSGSALFGFHDVLIVQVDADVAGETYRHGRIDEEIDDLPCVKKCPPPSATTNALRRVVLRWMGEATVPARCVLCTPSKNMEAWVVAALFPNDRLLKQKGSRWECHADRGAQLGQQPKAARVQKTRKDYESKRGEFVRTWPAVAKSLSEAKRFSKEFLSRIDSKPE